MRRVSERREPCTIEFIQSTVQFFRMIQSTVSACSACPEVNIFRVVDPVCNERLNSVEVRLRVHSRALRELARFNALRHT